MGAVRRRGGGGETTRCPNRTFLIRRITEAEAGADQADAAPEAGSAHDGAEDDAGATTTELAAIGADAGDSAPPADDGAGEETDASKTPHAARPLTKLTVDELRATYLEVAGRSTGSVNRAYLIWKVRGIQKGRVKAGPVQRRRHAPGRARARLQGAATAPGNRRRREPRRGRPAPGLRQP